MNPEIKAKWVAALRSGEYKQGRAYLRFDGAHCCLGVLCELAVKAGVASKRGLDKLTWFGDLDHRLEESAYLPDAVLKWTDYEINSIGALPILGRNNLAIELTECNDHLDMPFDQIADLIEYAL